MTSCLVVHGLPGSGKTYTSQILAKNLNLKLIIFDAIIDLISEYIRKYFHEDPLDSELDDYFLRIFDVGKDFEGFKNDLDKLIIHNKKFFETFYSKLVTKRSPHMKESMDSSNKLFDLAKNGDYLESISEDILKLVLQYLVKERPFFIIEGYYFGEKRKIRKNIEKLCEQVNYLGCFHNRTDSSFYYEYDGIKLTTIDEIQRKIKQDIFPSRQSYQYFESSCVDNSRADSKLTKLGIPENLDNKTVLDIGCNEGFFSFECEKRGAKVIGLEKDEYWYNLAMKRKNELSSFVNFLNENWNCLSDLNYKFDLVLFLGAFHYLKNNQLLMLKTIYDKMNKNGLLILELGLLNKNENEWLVEEVKRPKGDICQYTNKYSITKLLSDAGFSKILFYGRGEQVVGDDIPRYIIHATRTVDFQPTSIKHNKQSVIEQKNNSNEINLYNVENLLLRLYNKNFFYRSIFNLGFKIMKKLSR